LKKRIRALKIPPAAAELGRSLDHFNVPEQEKGEVLAAFAANKGEVIAGYTQ
jgi:hemoglobin